MSLGGSVVGAAQAASISFRVFAPPFLVGWYLVIFVCLFSFFFKGSRKMTTIGDGEEGGCAQSVFVCCGGAVCIVIGGVEYLCESSSELFFRERSEDLGLAMAIF